MLKPEFEEVQSGVAEIREVFRSSKFGNIAGVIVRSGTITPQRQGTRHPRRQRHRATTSPSSRCVGSRTTSPRSATDFECGIGLGKFNDIKDGDEIETIEMREKPRV